MRLCRQGGSSAAALWAINIQRLGVKLLTRGWRDTPSTAHPALPDSSSPADAAHPLPWSCLPSKAGTGIWGCKTFWPDSSGPCDFWRLFQYKLVFLWFGWRTCELSSSRVYLKDFFLLSDKTKPLTFWSPFKHPAQSCSKIFNFIIFTPSFSLKMSKAHNIRAAWMLHSKTAGTLALHLIGNSNGVCWWGSKSVWQRTAREEEGGDDVTRGSICVIISYMICSTEGSERC